MNLWAKQKISRENNKGGVFAWRREGGKKKRREIIFVPISFIFPSWHESRYGNANIFLCPEKSIIDF